MHNKPCPHSCLYCPTVKDTPKSYTGEEPAARRASMFNYNPYLQTKNRLKQLKAINHPVDKVELIIMGGTFPSLPLRFQENFAKRCFDAMNNSVSKNLKQAQKLNEKAKNRCVGLTIETRPDYCKKEHINQMLKLGTTRVELGVQTLSNEIYKKVNRGHTVEDVVEATKLLKNNCFKVCYHIMPGLLSTPKQDINMFRKLFSNPEFRPDMLKIYPTLVIKGTKLYEKWKKGEYEPMNNKEMAQHIAKLKTYIPKYVRVARIQRDIPSDLIKAGVTASNLRELVQKEMKREDKTCNCIRCHEVGHKIYKEGIKVEPENIKLISYEYKASDGTEIFLSYEDVKTDALIGFVRLRINDKPGFRPEITSKTALIRELRVFGSEVQIGKKDMAKWQHKGYGQKLLKEAERIAKEKFDEKEMIINSGIGVRKYYSERGYKLIGPYMMKKL
jgi:elongator complex protein 3